jgi:hypothetical protein
MQEKQPCHGCRSAGLHNNVHVMWLLRPVLALLQNHHVCMASIGAFADLAVDLTHDLTASGVGSHWKGVYLRHPL